MQAPDQIEEFAGQRILAMDPRTEKTLRNCPACNSTRKHELGVKNELNIVSCVECGSLYTPYSPWYSSAYYYVDYYEHGNLVEPPIVVKRLEEITSEFAPYRKTNRLLDVGCGAGTLMEAARANGWQAQGLDVSVSATKHVRSLGFEVFEGELSDAHYPDGHFDVVTAAELLEHLFEPAVVLKEIARILRPGGLFWTTTPHGCGLSARLLGLKWPMVSPPEHLQLLSIRGLRTLLSEAGFREVKLSSSGGNPIEIWRRLRQRSNETKLTERQSAERVAESYRLNEALTASPARQAVKNAINTCLNISSLGDSLKVFASR